MPKSPPSGSPMARIHWLEVHPTARGEALREALADGERRSSQPWPGSLVLVANHPDPGLIPAEGTEILWWVEQAEPEEVSAVLNLRPGWVLLQDRPLEAAREALLHLRERDLGSEGWLRQMMHLASLDELLRLVLDRAIRLSGARGGAIWLRRDDVFYQRAGDGSFPEAPLPRQEAAELVRRARPSSWRLPDSWASCDWPIPRNRRTSSCGASMTWNRSCSTPGA
jgi:hypothetical protein